MDVERHNLAEVERLNQRGGRTLSITDLIDAGTVSSEMAALCWLYGYIWGRDAVDFFGLWRRGFRCVSCLHADDPEQTREMLAGLGVSKEDLHHVSLQLFVRVSGGWARLRRRADSLHCVLDGRLRPVYRWRESDDGFQRLVDREDVCEALASRHGRPREEFLSRWDSHQAFLEGLLREGVRTFEAVRRRVVSHCGA